jgi:hypothetical protein
MRRRKERVLLGDEDGAKAQRAMQAIAALKRAHQGVA